MLLKNDKPLAVISFDTATCGLLKWYVGLEGHEFIRIHPDDFIANPDLSYQYINLVIKDFNLRKLISKKLDDVGADRWTFISQDVVGGAHIIATNRKVSVGKGCVIYPGAWAYSGIIDNDVIMHSLVKIAEDVRIGKGTIISGNTTIAGNCKIGQWCFIGPNIIIIDHVTIGDDITLLPGTNVRKSILHPGTFYNPYVFKIEQLTT